MKWIEVQIKTTTQAVDSISHIMYEIGIIGLVIEDPNDVSILEAESKLDYIDSNKLDYEFEGVIMKGYLEEGVDVQDKVRLIEEYIANMPDSIDTGLAEITHSEVEEQDWSETWRKYYKPQKVGERVVIRPSWEEYQKQENEVVVELDPGTAFGTGTHETTIMCIRELEKYVHNFDTVYDVGCGTGILGIVAAKLGALNVSCIDLDEEAVKVSKENIKKNGVSSVVVAKHGNLLDVVDGRANVVVANILADIIKILAKDIAQFIEEDGVFISSGIILDKIEEVKEALINENFEIVEVIELGEWACIVAKLGEIENA